MHTRFPSLNFNSLSKGSTELNFFNAGLFLSHFNRLSCDKYSQGKHNVVKDGTMYAYLSGSNSAE